MVTSRRPSSAALRTASRLSAVTRMPHRSIPMAQLSAHGGSSFACGRCKASNSHNTERKVSSYKGRKQHHEWIKWQGCARLIYLFEQVLSMHDGGPQVSQAWGNRTALRLHTLWICSLLQVVPGKHTASH